MTKRSPFPRARRSPKTKAPNLLDAVILWAIAVLFFGAVAQSAVGLGFGLVSLPFLVMLMGPHEAIRTMVLLALPLALLILLRDRSGLQAREAGLLYLPAGTVILLLGPIVKDAPQTFLAVAAGVFTLLAVGLLAVGVRSKWLGGTIGAFLAGVVSGAMNVVAGIGGPASALYAVNAGWSPSSIRPTLNMYFILIGTTTLITLGLPEIRPILLTGVFAGWFAGGILVARVSEALLRHAVLAVAALGGVLAIARAI